MSHAISEPSLEQLGDTLSAAMERDLRRQRRRPVRRIAFAVAVLAVVGTGTAAATGLFSPKQVAGGMPAGAAIFHDTNPSCTLNADGRVYSCTLATRPAPEVSDFRGVKELLTIDGKVAGGCIGLDLAGLNWSCFIGQDAVDQEILVKDLLGQPETEPGRG